MVGRFGDLHLIDGQWKIIGEIPDWERSRWCTPDFVRRVPLGTSQEFIVTYDDNDISEISRERRSSDTTGLPKDGLMGAGFVENKLDALLD